MNFLKSLGYFIPALIFVLVAVYLSSLITGTNGNSGGDSSKNKSPRSTVSCPADFPSYNALAAKPGHVLKLIAQRKSMFAANGEFVNSQVVITKSETEQSKVACGYLFVRAGTKSSALKSWENVYINPNDFGGHINPAGQIGPGDGNNFSEYLFPLNKISYWKNLTARGQNALSTADWAALLNVSTEVKFDIALNTEDKTGFIDELSIAYKCWNPNTGEENDGCSLNISGQSDVHSGSLK